MIKSKDIIYEAINGNDLACQVKIKGEIIGYVHFDKLDGQWIYQPLNGKKHTTGITRTIAVGKSILDNKERMMQKQS